MTQKLAEKAADRSTYVIQVSFYDEMGSAVAPSSIKWSLRDAEYTIVNSRQDVAVEIGRASCRERV